MSVARVQCHFHVPDSREAHQPTHLLDSYRSDRWFHFRNQRRNRFFPGRHIRWHFVLGVRVVKQYFHRPYAAGGRQWQVDVVVLQQFERDVVVHSIDLYVRVQCTFFPPIFLFLFVFFLCVFLSFCYSYPCGWFHQRLNQSYFTILNCRFLSGPVSGVCLIHWSLCSVFCAPFLCFFFYCRWSRKPATSCFRVFSGSPWRLPALWGLPLDWLLWCRSRRLVHWLIISQAPPRRPYRYVLILS